MSQSVTVITRPGAENHRRNHHFSKILQEIVGIFGFSCGGSLLKKSKPFMEREFLMSRGVRKKGSRWVKPWWKLTRHKVGVLSWQISSDVEDGD